MIAAARQTRYGAAAAGQWTHDRGGWGWWVACKGKLEGAAELDIGVAQLHGVGTRGGHPRRRDQQRRVSVVAEHNRVDGPHAVVQKVAPRVTTVVILNQAK